jgi:formylglycine-generating enzyme required for sulfatase activity/signal recognition particle receptor subunit beta
VTGWASGVRGDGMHDVNARMLEWCKSSDLMAKVRANERFNTLVPDVFCDNHERRTRASITLYELLWGAYSELGPCPDVQLFSSFEHDRVFYKNYREHICHSVKIFFLGSYLYEKNKEIKESIGSRLEELGFADKDNSFLLIWTAVSLFHDIGYLLENEQIEHDSTLRDKFFGSINERMGRPFSNMSIFSKEITAEKEYFFIDKNKIFTPNIRTIAQLENGAVFNVLNHFAKKSGLSYGNDVEKNGIQGYYQYAKSHKPNPGRSPYSDHGIVSVLLLLKIWKAYDEYFNEINSLNYAIAEGNNDLATRLKKVHEQLSAAKRGVEEAAGAIALHNINKDIWKKDETLAEGVDLEGFRIKLKDGDKLPFAFLLKLADELQCWDRVKYSSPEEGDQTLTSGDIDISPLSVTIDVWYKNDERFKAPANEAESKFGKLLINLRKYLDINGLIRYMSTEAQQEANEDTKFSENGISSISDEEVEYILKDIIEGVDGVDKIYSDMNVTERGTGLGEILKPDTVSYLSSKHPRILMAYTAHTAPLSHSFENPQEPLQLKGFDKLFDYFVQNKQVTLAGEPGSGKTTTLEVAAYRFAVKCLEDKTKPIPIIVDLSGMDKESVETYLKKHIDKQIFDLIGTDRLVLLLDGLNEIPQQAANKLVKWIAARPNQRLIVACRKIDYIERQLPIKRADIEPLDIMQIWDMMGKYLADEQRALLFWSLAGYEAKKAWNYFIKRNSASDPFRSFWYDDIGPVPIFENEKAIQSRLQEEYKMHKQLPGLLPLLSNPFLLFAAALEIPMPDQKVPDSKKDILIGFANKIFERNNIHSNLLQTLWDNSVWGEGLEFLDLAKDPGNWLAYCAFKMLEKGGGTAVPLPWLKNQLKTEFKETSVDTFIDDLLMANLLVTSGVRAINVKFYHQIMQEFFAAVYICTTKNYGKLSSLFGKEEWWKRSAWDETIRIAAELLADATELIQSLRKQKPDLAYSCISKGIHCKEEVRQTFFYPAKGPITPRAIADWGESLASNSRIDGRPGVGIKNGLPDFDWVFVKCGQITVGSKSEAGKEIGVAGNETSVELDDDFFISRYPTTRLQFETFVSDTDGYENKENWCDLGWRWKGTRSYPDLWDDSDYGLNNAPVVGVSWFEAMAFCRWASRKLAPKGWQIELPLEAEWEHAARSPDDREFPWGDDYCPGYANIDETTEGSSCGPFFLGKPTAVGIYANGASALGIADMCGNVWEWCKSKWSLQYKWPEVVSSEKIDHRVIKGGSWYNSIRFALSGTHDCLDADLSANDIGFRVLKKKSSRKDQDYPKALNATGSMEVKKILVLGADTSDLAKFVRSTSDFPLQEVQKKCLVKEEIIPMNYGRCFYKNNMYYIYAPLIDKNSINLRRFLEEMDGVILILGKMEYGKSNGETLSLMRELAAKQKIPFVLATSNSNLVEFTRERLQDFEGNISPLDIDNRSSCTKLFDEILRQTKEQA